MSDPIIYFIDDQASQRKMLEWDLRDLFGAGYQVISLPLHERKDDYHQYLDGTAVIGLLIDQRLNETGEVTSYTGVDLARHLRGTYPELPIYIVTGYDPDEQINGPESGSADAVVHKSELRADSPKATSFKQRLLRQAGRYKEALTRKQQRYRELLTGSLNGVLTPEQQTELASLENDRLLPTQASEKGLVSKLHKDIEDIERLLAKLPNLDKRENG